MELSKGQEHEFQIFKRIANEIGTSMGDVKWGDIEAKLLASKPLLPFQVRPRTWPD